MQDSLEIGNGKQSYREYKTQFSLVSHCVLDISLLLSSYIYGCS